MIIDKLGNTTYTTAQLAKRAQAEIARLWSKESEANIQRKIQGMALKLYTPTAQEQADITRYKTDLDTVQVRIAQAVIDNQDLINVIEYENAVSRLAQYKLETGSPSVPVYETQLDTKTGKQVQVKIGMTPDIKPLNLMVDEVTTDPITGVSTTKSVLNPEIVRDRAERASADAIVKGASATTVADYALRSAV